MNRTNGRGTAPDVALSPLNETFKFFLAHLPFSASARDIRDHFSKFGTVNFVKLVHDNKTGKSKGYGFLYMNDHNSDAAVENYANENRNRVEILNKPGVFLARNDQRRQNPIRNPNKKSHDEGLSLYKGPPVLANAPAVVDAVSSSRYPENYNAQVPVNVPTYGVQQVENSDHVSGSYNSHYGPSQPDVISLPTVPTAYPQQYMVTLPQDQVNSYVSSTAASLTNPNGLTPVLSQPSYGSTYTRLLLENLPPNATPDEISAGLYQYSLIVTHCTMEYDRDPKASWCYAHVDFADSEQASRCLSLAQQSLLEFRGRILTASIDGASQQTQVVQTHFPQVASAPVAQVQTQVAQPYVQQAHVSHAQLQQVPLPQAPEQQAQVIYQNPPMNYAANQPPGNILPQGGRTSTSVIPNSVVHGTSSGSNPGRNRPPHHHQSNRPPGRNRHRHKRRHKPY